MSRRLEELTFAAFIVVSICLSALAGGALAQEADWPRFRGPNGDGISRESKWNPNALTNAKIAWRANVGKGYSSVAIQGERLYTMGAVSNQDTVYCLNVSNGQPIWTNSYACKDGEYPGPRATPTVDGNRVYTLSRQGDLFCFDAENGKIKWQKNLVSDLQAKNIQWGFSGSPITHGEILLVNAGEAGIALNKETGEKVWANSPGTGGYATPVVFKSGDKDCVAMFGLKALNCVEARTGARIWSHKWVTGADVNAADPIVSDGKVFISSGYDKGCALLDITGNEPKEIWRNTGMKNHFSSSILIDGFLYGINDNVGKKNALKCVELATGAEKWRKEFGFGSLIAADGKLIILNDRGDIFVAKATPAGYEEIAVARSVLSKNCWTSPAMRGGMIYCRNNKGDIACVDVRE